MEIKWDNWDLLRQDINREDDIKTPLKLVKKTKNDILIVEKFKNPSIVFIFPAPEWFDINSLQYFADTSSRMMVVDSLAGNLVYGKRSGNYCTLSNGTLISAGYILYDKNIEKVDDKELEDYLLKEMI